MGRPTSVVGVYS